MSEFLIGFLAGNLIFGAVIIFQELRKAPVGFEDEEGFHFATKVDPASRAVVKLGNPKLSDTLQRVKARTGVNNAG